MTTPVAVKYMSRSEIESLMFSLRADTDNQQAELFEALVRRLLELIENNQLS